MKKVSLIGALLLMAVILFPSLGEAAGRLNFMLTNLTAVPITSVKIAPTYDPHSTTANLLGTELSASSRIYIGPNYYGQQSNWNITVGWQNGYEATFTHNKLTRYNSYVVYAGNYGVKMRQGYEPSYARSGYGTPRVLDGGYGGDVYVGTPELVNAVAMNNTGNVGASTRKTRDLVFEDEDDTAKPSVEGTSTDGVQGESIAVKTTVELTRDSAVSTVLPEEEFKSGDKVRLLFSASKDGYVYWLARGTSGQYQVLFPTAKAGMDNAVAKNKEYTVPAKGAWRFDDKKGTETLVCVLSEKKVDDLDKAVALAGQGKADDASRIIEGVVTGHESKRTTRDLVFEEENENDVNTKTQVSTGDQPFVATYELTHN